MNRTECYNHEHNLNDRSTGRGTRKYLFTSHQERAPEQKVGVMNTPHKFQLSAPIVAKLRSVARLVRNYLLIETALLIAVWCLSIFWLGGLLDYLPVTVGANETPRLVRAAILAIMGLGTAWILIAYLGRRLFVRLPQRSLALLIERKYPELNNELVTTVELSGRSDADVSNPVAHRAMLERVHRSISTRIAHVEPASLLNWQPIWGTGTAAVFGVVVTVIAAFGMPDWLSLWSTRLFSLADTPWPRRAVLHADGIQLQLPAFTGQLAAERIMVPFVAGLARVPTGAAAQLQVSADTQAVQVPEVCTLFYSSEDGSRGRANLRRVGAPVKGWQQFTLDGPPLDGLSTNLDFDVVGLDARLRDLKLEVIEPAMISDLQLECRYPKYLIDSLSSRAEVEQLPYRSGQRIPQGTELTLRGKAGSRLNKAQYVVRSTNSSATTEAPLEILSVTPVGKEFSIPLGVLESSLVVEIRLIDEYGLSADQIPRYLISMQEDTIPEVESRLEGIGIAITPNAILPIRGTVVDDHGIQEVAVELARNEDQPLKLPLTLKSAEEIESQIDLAQLAEQGRFQLAPSMTLGLVVSARDRYDLLGQQHVGLGQPQQLAVVTPDKLLVILDRQELELRQRLELIIAEIEQLRDALQETANSLSQGKTARTAPPTLKGVVHFQTSDEDGDKTDVAAQLRRIASLRAQQAVLQGDKSQQELASVAVRVDSIRLQLINNRIDSTDRQALLQEKVHQPLTALLAGDFEQLRRQLLEFQTASMSDAGGGTQARTAVAGTEQVLIALEAIKANMLDIESFSEIIDLVRDLLEDQDQILSETEKQQKQRILDLLK